MEKGDHIKTLIEEKISIFHCAKAIETGHTTGSLAHRILNRWTDIFILPWPAWAEAFNPNNATQTHSIFVKLSESIFLGMPKVRAWSIFTLSMP